MGAGAGKRVGVEENGETEVTHYRLKPAATVATVVSVLPKTGVSEDHLQSDAGSRFGSGREEAFSPVSQVVKVQVRSAQVSPAHSPDSERSRHSGHSHRDRAVVHMEAPAGLDDMDSPSSAGVAVRGSVGAKGDFAPGQRVKLIGLVSAGHLNGREAKTLLWDADSGRWLIRMTNGEEKRVRSENLQVLPRGSVAGGGPSTIGSGRGVEKRLTDGLAVNGGTGLGPASDANKELEGLLLQSNWSAIYQLFHQRFGVTDLDRLDRGYVVKSAVEMTLSIVAKCFALLRSDPSGRLHCTPLHIAALQSSTEAAEVIVRELPQMVLQTHLPSHTALCPLHIGILCGAQTVVELLLEGQANPNVRTLHDVCPIHLAACTSKDMCQLLLIYKAEPQLRDVMGSGALHYAAAFKQQGAMELLLAQSGSAQLARDVDQKRVTPLHISCALYADEDDFLGPMSLLAHGAKPWQADCHGAAACELVPWAQGSALKEFFEKNGDKAQSAAQAWLDERYLGGETSRNDGEEDTYVSPQRSLAASPGGAGMNSPREKMTRKKTISEAQGSVAGAGAPSGRLAELTAEVERLQKELGASHEARTQLEKDRGELEHLRQKVSILEQSAINHQKLFDGLQTLHESERSQHKEQVESMQRRHAAELQDWEVRLKTQVESARLELRQQHGRKLEDHQRDAARRMQELQAGCEAVRVDGEAKAEELRLASKPSRSPSPTFAGGVERVPKGQLARLEASDEQLRNLRAGLQRLCWTHAVGLGGEAITSPKERASDDAVVAALDTQLARLRAGEDGAAKEAKVARDQLRVQQEEAAAMRHRLAEAEDQVRRLTLEMQEMDGRSSAEMHKAQSKLQDYELRSSQAANSFRGDAEAARRRAEEAEAQCRQMQPRIDRLTKQLRDLEDVFDHEQKLRKKFHNQIQDMKGAIRVFCRFRPLIAREAGETPAIRRKDAFTVDLSRAGKDGAVDTRQFAFDSVFDDVSTQEEIFSDCKELVQSAVDGYNVTIFAYGQTGAGKTHTMYGTPEQPGLVPRSIQTLFEVIRNEEKRGKTFKVKTYMIEVYKQDILDLLADKPPKEAVGRFANGKEKPSGLEVKKDIGRGMMYVDGVKEIEVNSPKELMAILKEGEKRRHVAETKMNSQSSRSHLLLSVVIEGRVKDTGQILYGKITLCDLAGSERPKKSEVSGDALKEAIEINKSLTALGDVIEALTKGSKSVPYRNHKLTMLMQDSLGGSAKTLMFVNCSPAGSNYEETMMSLKWATRARQVTNDVKRNADSKEVARLKQVITMMSQAQNAESILDDAAYPEMRPEEPTNLHGSMTNFDLETAMNATMRT